MWDKMNLLHAKLYKSSAMAGNCLMWRPRIFYCFYFQLKKRGDCNDLRLDSEFFSLKNIQMELDLINYLVNCEGYLHHDLLAMLSQLNNR